MQLWHLYMEKPVLYTVIAVDVPAEEPEIAPVLELVTVTYPLFDDHVPLPSPV